MIILDSKRQSPLETKGLCDSFLSFPASKNAPDLTAYFAIGVLRCMCIYIGQPSIHEAHQIGKRSALQGSDQIIPSQGSPHHTTVYTDASCDGTEQECHDRSILASCAPVDVGFGEIQQIEDG